MTTQILVRPLREADLKKADHILRLAFGTFLGLPDPLSFMGDATCVRPRWLADPSAAIGAQVGRTLVGSSFATNWGSFGFFGPLTVHPKFWDRGIAKHLVEAMLGCFERWGTRQAGLYTFANSPKHLGLYQKFGFFPQLLTAVMSKPISTRRSAVSCMRMSRLTENDQSAALKACTELTNAVYEGLNVEQEIRAVRDQKLGDTVLLWEGSQLHGMAACHYGAGTEAGSSRCYIKFAAARPGPKAGRAFEALLDGCEAMAEAERLSLMVAGTNIARREACLHLFARGFQTDRQGIAMQKPNEPGYNRPGVYVVDDWR